jgi:membrane protease YdiL (CAAX protease family)
MKRVIAVTVLVALTLTYATSSLAQGKLSFWLALAGAYLLTGALAVHKMWDDGTLYDVLRPRWGDLSIGLVLAAVIGLAGWGALMVLAPQGSPRQGWLFQIYLQLAAPAVMGRHAILTLAIVLIAVLEELTWRGLVQRLLEERFGTRRGWILAGVLYTLCHVPTAFGLSDPTAGYNPLLVVAALGAGLCWGFTVRLVGRLPPVFVSHAAFAYFMYEFNRPF